jgi:hypothetical protein
LTSWTLTDRKESCSCRPRPIVSRYGGNHTASYSPTDSSGPCCPDDVRRTLIRLQAPLRESQWGKAQVTGQEAATRLLDRVGLQAVKVLEAPDPAAPNYHSPSGEIRLPPSYYRDKSLLAVVSAAHEVGRAVQVQRFAILRQWTQNQFSLFWALTITSGGALVIGGLRESTSLVHQGALLLYGNG